MSVARQKASTSRAKRSTTKESPAKKTKGKSSCYWSGEVTRNSNALDLESNVFASKSPGRIAASLKRSAEASKRRKGTPYQSAMSMLNFYINRAGRSLSEKQRDILERAKPELRKAFGRAGQKKG